MTREYQPLQAPTGKDLTCRAWPIEGPYRMLLASLQDGVAEDPRNLIVAHGASRPVRTWEAFDATTRALREMGPDQTLLIQSGVPVGVFDTHLHAPRVLMANGLLVPAWASWEEFRELERAGVTFYGQTAPASWTYIGVQGALPLIYQTLAEIARDKFGSTLTNRLLVTAGLGTEGAAQPLAGTLLGAAVLVAEANPARAQWAQQAGYVQEAVEDLDAAIDAAVAAKDAGENKAIAWMGSAVQLMRKLVERDVVPDILTDMTPAHDLGTGYLPDKPLEEIAQMREADPRAVEAKALETITEHVSLMVELKEKGALAFEFGNNLRGQAELAGFEKAFDIPGYVSAFLRPHFSLGLGPVYIVALSGNDEDLQAIDEKLKEEFSEDEGLKLWLDAVGPHVPRQGMPARALWLAPADRLKAGAILNQMVRDGDVAAPLVMTRDHFDAGSVASPVRETEQMQDGSDAVADWPILNALLNTAGGASWVAVHHGGGVGVGYSIHSVMGLVLNGSPETDQRAARVLAADPSLGIARHATAGYIEAQQAAEAANLNIPILKKPEA